MEDKQLNINQPLLSVRRYSSLVASEKNDKRKYGSCLPTTPSIDHYKTELKTGSVPFVWEHSPGRPKNGTNKQVQTKESPPSLPKLPPGRILKPKKKDLDNITEDNSITKGPRMDHFNSPSVLPTEEKFESSKSTKKGGSDSGDDDDDEAYMDALDTLSQAESSFYNCSASGVSGFGSDVKPSGIFSADPKVRDFMMGRFLPAAKAMVSEVPQHTPRKHVVEEKPREVKKLVYMDSKKLQLRYGPNFLQDDAHDNEEESDYDYDYDDHGNISSTLCGLLPRFCLKGSVGPVNPVPGMSMRTRLPMYPANRTHASSSSISSFSETENEPARVAIYEHRSFGGSHLAKHEEDKSILKSESIITTNQNNSQKLDGLGLYNRLQGRGFSTSPNESSLSSVSERNDSSSQKKGLTSFKELLADKNKMETDSESPMVEKTLYVDPVQTVKSKANSLPSSIKEQSNFTAYDMDTTESLHISCESLESDIPADESEHHTKSEKHTGSWKDPEADTELLDHMNGNQNSKASQYSILELPAPPPLPKSPSDSWLWRTLPSMSSKHAPTRWNPKYPSSNPISTDPKLDKIMPLRYSQVPLLPIPET